MPKLLDKVASQALATGWKHSAIGVTKLVLHQYCEHHFQHESSIGVTPFLPSSILTSPPSCIGNLGLEEGGLPV